MSKGRTFVVGVASGHYLGRVENIHVTVAIKPHGQEISDHIRALQALEEALRIAEMRVEEPCDGCPKCEFGSQVDIEIPAAVKGN